MPPRFPVYVALVLIGILLSIPTATAYAQQGVTTFTGLVTINGEPAPEETLVRITLEDGGVLGSTLTGFGGLKPNEFRLEIESDPAYAGKKVNRAGNSISRKKTPGLAGGLRTPCPRAFVADIACGACVKKYRGGVRGAGGKPRRGVMCFA